MTSNNSTETSPSAHSNSHGVDMREVCESDSWPIRTDEFGRTVATILDSNISEDEYHIRISTNYERFERTVTADAFRQRITTVDDPISDDGFDSLAELDGVSFYARGHERRARGWVEEVDHENDRVHVTGEVNCQTLSRWVPQSLIYGKAT